MHIQKVYDAAEQTWLVCKSKSYCNVMKQSVRHFADATPGHSDVRDITIGDIERYRLALRSRLAEYTARTYVRHLLALLGYAVMDGLLESVPKPPRQKPVSSPRTHTVTEDEFCVAVKSAPPRLQRLLHCMFLGGLRIGEAINLRWREGMTHVSYEKAYPVIVFQANSQKSGVCEEMPLTKPFCEYLANIRNYKVTGELVCGLQWTTAHASREVAKVLGDCGLGGTAHDLRRSFGTHWATKVQPAVLMKMMRHADVSTTMKYYVHLDSQNIAKDLHGM